MGMLTSNIGIQTSSERLTSAQWFHIILSFQRGKRKTHCLALQTVHPGPTFWLFKQIHDAPSWMGESWVVPSIGRRQGTIRMNYLHYQCYKKNVDITWCGPHLYRYWLKNKNRKDSLIEHGRICGTFSPLTQPKPSMIVMKLIFFR